MKTMKPALTGIFILVMFFSCKKKETCLPAQTSIDLVINGQKVNDVKLVSIKKGFNFSGMYYLVRLSYPDSANLFMMFPLIAGKDLDSSDNANAEMEKFNRNYVTVSSRLYLNGYVDNETYTSFSGACNFSCYHPRTKFDTLKINCTFNNLLYEK